MHETTTAERVLNIVMIFGFFLIIPIALFILLFAGFLIKRQEKYPEIYTLKDHFRDTYSFWSSPKKILSEVRDVGQETWTFLRGIFFIAIGIAGLILVVVIGSYVFKGIAAIPVSLALIIGSLIIAGAITSSR